MEHNKCSPQSMAVHAHNPHEHGKREAAQEREVKMAPRENGANKTPHANSDKETPHENEADKTTDEEDGVPYDKGWAWMCVLSAFIMNAVVIGGFVKSFGVFFTTILERFGTTAGATSWVTALFLVFVNCTGTVVQFVAGKMGLKFLAVTGGMLSGCGVLLSIMVTRVEYMYLTYGVMAGLGSGICFNLCMTTVSQYFKKRRGLANGLAVSGSSVGSFVIPPLFSIILNHYGFFGAFLLFASLGFHLCISGALLRPPEHYIRRHRKNQGQQPKLSAHSEVHKRSFNVTSLFFGVTVPDVLQKAERSEVPAFPTVHTGLKGVLVGTVGQNGTLSTTRDNDQNKWRCCSRGCREHATSEEASKRNIRVNVDFNLFKERVFLIYIVVIALTFTAYPSIFYMITAHSEELGYSKTQASLLISVHGGADFVGRLLLGFVADLKFIRKSMLYAMSLAFNGITCFLFPASRAYVFLIIASASHGLWVGSCIPLMPTMLADTFGIERLPASFSLALFFLGVSMIAGAPLAGFLRDKTGNWHATFYMVGGLAVLGTLIMLLELIIIPPKFISDRKNKPQCNETSRAQQNEQTLYENDNEKNEVFPMKTLNRFPLSDEELDASSSGNAKTGRESGIPVDWKPSNSNGSFINKVYDENE